MYGCPNKLHYGSWPCVCLSVCLSVRLLQASNSNTRLKAKKNQKLVWTFPRTE